MNLDNLKGHGLDILKAVLAAAAIAAINALLQQLGVYHVISPDKVVMISGAFIALKIFS